MNEVIVVGAGLAGCEAALRIANSGIKVKLYEMKPDKKSPAHRLDSYAELVCSNSLKADRLSSASGLLKAEMRILGSICLEAAAQSSVAAGGALAVDRNTFSQYITKKLVDNKNIQIINETITDIPLDKLCIIATGPLTDDTLALNIQKLCGTNNLSFYDAAAPIITAESIDMSVAFKASRYDKGDADYINCPMNKEEYETFYNELVSAQTAELHAFDKSINVYEGCMPIEIMAKRGEDSIRFGPLKPVGLKDPRTNNRPYAVVQLRSENRECSLYNLVGFQTNLKFPEQKRVFSLIPGLSNAEFVRYGVMHRNSFIDSPKLLNRNLSLKSHPNIFFAGQITGVEGYMESAACGIIAGENVLRFINGQDPLNLPTITMLGALINHVTNSTSSDFQPMGANFGIVDPLNERIKVKAERYTALSNRSLDWYNQNQP
ncbi:MAG: methylenetetrahydrofolate--tRNA-(uracil(54)-C(5))-methyltransferase (FADH(2)-oxidizing) TrmFO [Ruminococcaceae bacterium]|nr:methylenetetrahydrofolate--tRNA-(uracil(54)-C(5))-methyltransferase (FADH(2)-oxidizing) TrmFO [Oscillospiraceae bacterium]